MAVVTTVPVVSSKPTAKKGKKPSKPKTDGRANPAQFDPEKFANPVDAKKAKRLLASGNTHYSPIAHQSGKGTRGERGAHCFADGTWVSKVTIVRACGALGLSQEVAWAALTQYGLPMTPEVFSKSYGQGGNLTTTDAKALLTSEAYTPALLAELKKIKA